MICQGVFFFFCVRVLFCFFVSQKGKQCAFDKLICYNNSPAAGNVWRGLQTGRQEVQKDAKGWGRVLSLW